MMLLLYLSVASVIDAINVDLNKFKNFKVEFNSTCPKYLTLIGDDSYLFLYQKHEHVQLWMRQNQSHSMFIAPLSNKVVFHWPEIMINNEPMIEIDSEGDVKMPFEFQDNQMFCNVLGISAGFVDSGESECQVYKCPVNKDWKFYLPIVISIAVFLVILPILYGFKDGVPQFFPKYRRCNSLDGHSSAKGTSV